MIHAHHRAFALAACIAAIATQAPAQEPVTCCAAVMILGSENEPLPPARRDFRVWVEPSARIYGWRPTYVNAVREAFAQWEEVGLPVSFAFVSDSNEANLLVYWRRQLEHQLRGRSTWWTMADVGYVRGEIEIAVGGADGGGLDHGLVRGITLHEVGHLLGLRHVSDPSSIMARTVRVRELSRRDLQSARALYLPLSSSQ